MNLTLHGEEIFKSSLSLICPHFSFGCLTSVKLGRGGAADGREIELGNMVCLLYTFQMSLPKETAPKKE